MAVPFMTYASTSFELQARFNFFENNNGGILIVTGAHSSVPGIGSKTFAPLRPTSLINYNQFVPGSIVNYFDIAMVALGEIVAPQQGAVDPPPPSSGVF